MFKFIFAKFKNVGLKRYSLISSLILCLTAGVLGSFFVFPSLENWYVLLNKPNFTPPNFLFGPVWTTLYILMGIALFRVHQKGEEVILVRQALTLFAIQLILNVLWVWFFFGLQNPFLGFLEILVLWFVILLTIIWFLRIDKLAAVLLIPYLFWVSFATFLNYSIWQLN